MKLQSYSLGVFLFIASVFILYIGKSILLPLSVAIISWFLISELLRHMAKVSIAKRQLPFLVQKLLAFALVLGIFFLISTLISSSVLGIKAQVPLYEANLTRLLNSSNLLQRVDFGTWMQNAIESIDVANSVGMVVNSVTLLFSNAVLILLYLLFILLESSQFTSKLQYIYTDAKQRDQINSMVQNISQSMSSYISLKTLTSFATGALSFIALKIIGVDFAFFWAFLIFILNFIPTIGSLLATIFPVLLALVQFGSFGPATAVLITVTGIQFLVGNILEPKLMGNTLNVSPLVVLISLAFWGWLWGIIGMVISVPIAIMGIIVCSQFEETRWIAVILSGDGKLPKISHKNAIQKAK